LKWILGREAQKIWKIEIPEEIWEHTLNKTTKKLLNEIENNCKNYIVVDNMSFYKKRLVTYSLFYI